MKLLSFGAVVLIAYVSSIQANPVDQVSQNSALNAYDYSIEGAEARQVQLQVIGTGPNPAVASNVAVMLLRARCVQLAGTLMGFPSFVTLGRGFSYSVIATQLCMTN